MAQVRTPANDNSGPSSAVSATMAEALDTLTVILARRFVASLLAANDNEPAPSAEEPLLDGLASD
jgi:hypothetical protein